MLCGCTPQVPPEPSPSVTPVFPAAVGLVSSAGLQARGVTIGLLVGPLAGPGSDFRQVVNGAKVAAFRFGLDGLNVSFRVIGDDGTAPGAWSGMRALIEENVAGVVVASAGVHLAEALQEATDAGMPVLLPYDYTDQVSPPVYRTGPDADVVRAAIESTLSASGVSHPVVVRQDDYTITSGWGQELSYSGDPVATGQAVVKAVTDGGADVVVVEASGDVEASIVSNVQALMGSRQLPVVLTPQALTPAFSAGLGAVADLRGVLMTVGQDTGDTVALQSGVRGDRTSAFLQAVRMASDNATTLNVFGDDTFASVAAYADVASHDAVVALVRAAEKVADGDAQSEAAALTGLSLTDMDGLVGGPLDFSSADALSASSIVTLFASSQAAGLRPATPDGTTPPIAWVAVE